MHQLSIYKLEFESDMNTTNAEHVKTEYEDLSLAGPGAHRPELPVLAWRLNYYEEWEYRGNGILCHGSAFRWVLTDPMADRRREIVGNFKI